MTLEYSVPQGICRRYYRALALNRRAYETAESYCARAGVVGTAARKGVHDFVNGLSGVGLLTNLLDFALFCQGQNTETGSPVSWQNRAVVEGTLYRHRGGLELRNNTLASTNHFYFTNLAGPTASGSTLLWWGAGSMTAGPRPSDGNISMGELTSARSPLPGTIIGLYNGIGRYMPVTWNGVIQRFHTDANGNWYGPSGNAYALFCAGYTWMPGGCRVLMKVDYPSAVFEYRQNDPFPEPPEVVRFGQRSTSPDVGWWGLVRAFAYFSRPLSTNEILFVDSLLPRVGLVIEGDSKSVPPQNWWQWWAQNPNAWGLYSVRTNSAQSGSMVSSNNTFAYYRSPTFSAESRFALNAANYQTNRTFPLQIYALRSGHNDLNATNAPNIVPNVLTAMTNLWSLAKSNGWKVAGWTLDRTFFTWQSTGVFAAGASNALMEINQELRENSPLCDYLVDNEAFYVQEYGNLPYLNSSIYPDMVHDGGGSAALGTNLLLRCATPSLGYEEKGSPVAAVRQPALIKAQ